LGIPERLINVGLLALCKEGETSPTELDDAARARRQSAGRNRVSILSSNCFSSLTEEKGIKSPVVEEDKPNITRGSGPEGGRDSLSILSKLVIPDRSIDVGLLVTLLEGASEDEGPTSLAVGEHDPDTTRDCGTVEGRDPLSMLPSNSVP
jgi:hypothetical protein